MIKRRKHFLFSLIYDKAEDISDTTKYEDHFIPGFRDRLIAISKSGRNLQSEDVQNFLKAKERGIQVELFVRKNKDDKDFEGVLLSWSYDSKWKYQRIYNDKYRENSSGNRVDT